MNCILYAPALYIMKKKNNMYKHINIPCFNALNASNKLISLMKNEENKVGKFSWRCYQIRRSKYIHKHATGSFPNILLKKITYRLHEELGTIVIFISMNVTLILYMSINIFCICICICIYHIGRK